MPLTIHVDGEISPDYGALRALAAGLPAGTVSGAPKVRAMEIIDELEPDRTRHLFGLHRLFWGRWRHGYLHRLAHRRR